jgi:5-(carboxyamino)imidazole ribonucleotide synthase
VKALAPGASIGILGGGQLGRMLALAAARLGLKCHIFCPDLQSAAFEVVRRTTVADYDDNSALDRFARSVDVITYEFENVPAAAARFLAARKPVFPDPAVLATTQDRFIEKTFMSDLGIATAAFAPVASRDELTSALARIGRPAVIKTRRLGYDGKGQATIRDDTDLDKVWRDIGGHPAIVESFVPFEREISLVVARGADGAIECFDVAENEHGDHILRVSRVPAAISQEVAVQARHIAETIASAFAYVGVLAVEMFVLREGAGHAVLVNEIAPRVHNSGHWTIDGCSVSQFEQHLRAIAGWPLGKPIRHGRIEMINLIGAEIETYAQWLEVPGACLHLYGKGAPRPRRKMGHVTRVFPESGA